MQDVTPIDEFNGLNGWARNALKSVGIFTLEDAAMQTDEYLLSLTGFGEGSLKSLREWEHANGVPGMAPSQDLQQMVEELNAERMDRERYDLARDILVGVCTTKAKSSPVSADDAWFTASRLVQLYEDSRRDPS